MKRLVAATGLALRFARAVAVSGLETVVVILKTGRPGGTPPPAALVRVRFAPMSGSSGAFGSRLDRGWVPPTIKDLEAEERAAEKASAPKYPTG